MLRKSLAALVVAALVPTAGRAQHAIERIDSMALRAYTYLLAHDLLEGRGTGARGADVAGLYLATEAERLGLRGAGDGGGFFQTVPLVEATIDTMASTLVLRSDEPLGTTRVTFRTPRSFLPNVGTARTLVSFRGDLVWVASASAVLAHPEQLPPLAGRVAVMAGVFGADLAAADTLRERGAVGVVHVLGQAGQYALYARNLGPARLFVAESAAVRSSFVPAIPSVLVGPAVAALIVPTGATEEALARPFVLTGRQLQLTLVLRARPVQARNVAAMLPGADPGMRDEFVVFTAHYDHLGISVPDERGDSIYNGFSDNAAGCAMLLAIAKALISERPARSALFLWFTGEEPGLLGSDYYAAHPTLPPGRLAAAINLDAGAPPAPSTQWRIAGGDRSSLGPRAVEVARRSGWEAQVTPATPNSDYFPLLRIGVPAVFIVPGPAGYEGLSDDSSNALRRRWDHYHQAADEWAADFPFSGLVRYASFALRLGREVARGSRATMSPGR
jgi:hypothetical protein